MSEPSEAWARWCDRLAAAGRRILEDDFPSDPTARAEGHRHLARLAVMALQSHLEFADPDFPAFHRYDDDAVKWGGPNVDNHYLRARIDPAGTYRIVGDVTGVRDLIVSTHEGDMQLEQYGVFAERRLDELAVGPDGRLEVVVGGPERAGAWLPLDPAARIVMIRVYVADWAADGCGWFDIERLDRPTERPVPLAPQTVADGLDAAAEWVERSVVYWRDYLETSPVRGLVNRLSPPRGAAGGSDRIRYGAGWWELAPGEVLLVELRAPEADYWSFQLYSTPWFESLDVRNRINSFTGATAVVDADGIVRLVVAADDPGAANWLDTEGRPAGMISYRFVGCDDPPAPTATRLTSAAELPTVTTRVDAAERQAQIDARRRGIARRFRR